MLLKTLILLCLVMLSGCSKPEADEPALPVIDPATGEAYISEEVVLYNNYLGISITLPADTRLYELENLGLTPSDFGSDHELSCTNYGDDATVFSLADIAIDRGGSSNFCRVILAVEQMDSSISVDDFSVLLSRRMAALSVDEDYQIYFEGKEYVVMGGEDFCKLTFTESQPGHDDYRYEVYVRKIEAGFFTAVIFYSLGGGDLSGAAVGQSYIESGISFFA